MAIAPTKDFQQQKEQKHCDSHSQKKPMKTRLSRIVITVFTHGSIFKCRIKAIRLHSLRLEYTKISEYTSPTPEKFRNTALQRCSATTAPSHRNPTSYASSPLHPDIPSGADERQTPLSGTAATVFDTKAAATTSARSSTSRPSAPRAIAFYKVDKPLRSSPLP